jgi:lipopolysaccharide export system protein LptA
MRANPPIRVWLAATLAAAGVTLAQAAPPAPATAQQPSGPANALQGFAQNRNEPVKINAATLEVRDKDKVATFSGGVRVVQGDTMMQSRTLAVFYDGDGSTANALTAAKPGPAGQQKIRRLEAKGGVKVCQADQVATGNEGIFDMQANTVTLIGNVVLTKDPNVMKGEKLTVNLDTGAAKIEGAGGGVSKSSTSGGVSMLIFPKTIEEAAKSDKDPKKKAEAAAHKPSCVP